MKGRYETRREYVVVDNHRGRGRGHAYGRDYDDVSPLKGIVLGGGQHTVRVDVACVAVPRNS